VSRDKMDKKTEVEDKQVNKNKQEEEEEQD
jgi:hypothetical protein